MILFLFSTAADAFAFRCGRKIVEIGDHKSDVLQICGEPEFTEQRRGIAGSRFRYPRGTLSIDRYEEVVIDEWIYNFGPTKFKQILWFENGYLIETDHLGYGD